MIQLTGDYLGAIESIKGNRKPDLHQQHDGLGDSLSALVTAATTRNQGLPCPHSWQEGTG